MSDWWQQNGKAMGFMPNLVAIPVAAEILTPALQVLALRALEQIHRTEYSI